MARWLFVLMTLALSFGCFGGGSGSADGGGGAAVCDGKDSCNECTLCANQNPCASAMNACQQNSACTGLDQCIAICGSDVSCKNDCYNNNPGGLPLYNAWASCLYCDECPSDCAGYMTCN